MGFPLAPIVLDGADRPHAANHQKPRKDSSSGSSAASLRIRFLARW